MNKSIRITKIDDIDTNNELFTNFYNKLNEFKLNADQKIKQFDLELNKLETFHHQNNDNHHDDDHGDVWGGGAWASHDGPPLSPPAAVQPQSHALRW